MLISTLKPMHEETESDLHDRLKSAEIMIRWIIGGLASLIMGGLFLVRMRFDVDAHHIILEDHTIAIKTLEHNDTVNAQKIDAIKATVERIDRKIDQK